MSELQSLSAYSAAAPPAVEEISVKARKPDDEKFGFFDFLDIINPLQHIPIVNTIYREMTGDEIKPPAKMIGSALIGGPVGLAVAMADSVLEDTTGKDMGGHAMAWMRGDAADTPATPAAATALAAQSATSVPAAGREFIPTMVTTAAAQAMAQPLLNDSEDDERQTTTDPRPEQTEAAIAASAAAAPRGLVFMPLPGRGQSGTGPSAKRVDADQRFMPLNTMDRAAPRATEPAVPPAAAARAAMAQVQTALAGYRPSASDSATALLEATKPTGDTGDLPPLDPFAAAREVSGQGTGPMQVPAWFDRAMMDAVDKYRAMNTRR